MASGLKQRIQTAIIFGAIVLFLVFFNDQSRLAFLSLLAMLASWEYLGILKEKIKAKRFVYYLLGLALISFVFYFKEYNFYIVCLSLLIQIILIWDLFYNKKALLHDWPSLFNIGYVILPISCLMTFYGEKIFFQLIVAILLMIWISDVSAYFVGKSIGKRKLYPSVSPGKTWEGFLGAGLITVMSSFIFFTLFESFTLQIWALFGLCIWLFGSIGDLVESKFKRKVGIKDSGTIMPGHGGFLDRFDGFIFCIPFVLIIVILVKIQN